MAEKKSSNSNAGPKKRRSKLSKEIIVALIGAIATILAALLAVLLPPLLSQFQKGSTASPSTETPSIAPTAEPSVAAVLTTTPAPTIFNPHPVPEDQPDNKGVPMRLVPEGDFMMGSENGNDDEKPVKEVYLKDFYIDKYEVTNVLYKACVNEHRCQPLTETKSTNVSRYYGSSDFDNYPVVYVDWNMATTYCKWRGARLPTEAEWEKAARGTDGRIYPWGNVIACFNANYGGCGIGHTTSVGISSTESPYGVYDMAGNVWEWVSSGYRPYPYDPQDGREDSNATIPRVIRGGSWGNDKHNIRSANRNYGIQTNRSALIGFRCAKDAP